MNEEERTILPRNVGLRMKAVYDTLKPAEKKGADYLMNSADQISHMTITELAKAAGCSEATIFRLAKKLGYNGFSNFKEDLQNNKKSIGFDIFEAFKRDDSPEEVLKKTFQISIQALEDTLNAMDIKVFSEAAMALKKAKRTVAFASGDAIPVANVLYNCFLRVGKEVYAPSDIDSINIICSQLSKNDVLVCISHSGATRSVVQVAKRARRQGVQVIAITNFPLSQLAKNADYVLYTAVFTEGIKGEIISKRLPEMCIVESLFLVMILNDSRYETSIQTAINATRFNKYN